jgi:hypothetical protein
MDGFSHETDVSIATIGLARILLIAASPRFCLIAYERSFSHEKKQSLYRIGHKLMQEGSAIYQ